MQSDLVGGLNYYTDNPFSVDEYGKCRLFKPVNDWSLNIFTYNDSQKSLPKEEVFKKSCNVVCMSISNLGSWTI